MQELTDIKPVATETIEEELALFKAMKPYIGHCLVMNHEINNLLSGIIGYTEFLLVEADELTEEHRSFIKQVLSCANRLNNLVENLSDEKIMLNEKFDLKQIIDAYKKVAKPLD